MTSQAFPEEPAADSVPAGAASIGSSHWCTPFRFWLLIVVILIGSHATFYFSTPYYEARDFGANALQIRDAKRFEELHGHYSRWGFNHPGPAFFYVYALGEAVLFDALRLFPAPFNAHLATGVLMQALFFTWAVWIARRRAPLPLLTALLLVLAGLHFGLVNFHLPDSAFQSIWPSHFLLFPLVCFLVASASVASGAAKDLVPLVLSGSFVVHGHIEQALIVVPTAVGAYAHFAIFTSSRGGQRFWSRLRSHAASHAIAAAILVVFLFPLVLDAARAQQSNLRLILQQLSAQAGDHKSLAQSAVYFLTFLCYVRTPHQYSNVLNASSLSFLTERWPCVVMWLLVLGGAIVLSRSRRKNGTTADAQFIRCLWCVFGGAVGLTLVWGKLQAGEMYGFNAYFNYGILFIPFILLAIALASTGAVTRIRHLEGALFALGGALLLAASWNFSFGTEFREYTQSDTPEFVRQIEAAARADQQPSRTKLLIFDAADRQWAVGVALALERAGYAYAVPPEFFVQFGAEHVVNPAEAVGAGRVALWRIRRADSPQDSWISYSPAKIDPSAGTIRFAGPDANFSTYAVSGWQRPQEAFAWSVSATPALYFERLPASSDVELQCELFGPDDAARRVAVRFNAETLTEFEVGARGIFTARVPAALWNQRRYCALTFDVSDAVSPKHAGPADPPRVRCGFVAIHVRSVPSTIPAVTNDPGERL